MRSIALLLFAVAAQAQSTSALLSDAQARRLRGDYANAERLYRQVLARKERGFATQIAADKGLALLCQATRRYQEAFDEQTVALSSEQELMTRHLEHSEPVPKGSEIVSDEAQLRADAASSVESLEVLVSMAAEDLKLPESRRPVSSSLMPMPYKLTVQRYALAWTLLRKGIALDTLARLRWLGKPDANRTQRIHELRASLSEIALRPPAGLDAAAQAKLKHQLQHELEIQEDLVALDNVMNPQNEMADAPLQVGDLFRYSGETELDKMDDSTPLPAGAVLVEFLRARVFDFHALSAARTWKPAHYFAFVLTSAKAGPVAMLDLGEAAAIDAAIKDVRRNILDFTAAYTRDAAGPDYEKQKEAEYRDRSRKLYDLVFAPLRPSIGSAHLIYIAPDSELNRISFEALGTLGPDHQFAYLVESYRFAYLSSGRDLAPPSAAMGRGTIVLADPDYDLGAETRQRLVSSLRGAQASGPAPGSLASFAADVVGYQPWPPLHASAHEADVVRQELQNTSYGPVQEYLGAQALEERLLSVQSPRILHIATHGFFLPGADDPLLRSGILLAGANTLGKGASRTAVASGWVTAEDIMSMDLHGTELVVLSGCDTGLGDIQTGEGVFGLRRAFLYAGARSLLVSLYKVPDEETVQLMSQFYESLKRGAGVLDSLHQAQLAVMASKRHPFYWASFVLVGVGS